jgi:hypothetical protein
MKTAFPALEPMCLSGSTQSQNELSLAELVHGVIHQVDEFRLVVPLSISGKRAQYPATMELKMSDD